MFYGIEIIIGSLGALIGIGGGYLVLSAFFAGIRHITKPGAVEVKETTREKIATWTRRLYRKGLTVEDFCVIMLLRIGTKGLPLCFFLVPGTL